jgi:hypothetical protein
VHQRPVRPGWASQLILDLAGTPERNEANVITALSNDEAFAGALVFDEFRQETMVNRALPWDEDAASPPAMGRCRRRAVRRVASASRDQRRTYRRQPQRHRSRP